MQVKVKIARSAQELDELFRARHRVFVEEEGYFPSRPEGRVFDRFDSFPTTINVVALVGDTVVGGARFVETSEVGLTTDEFFDFRPFLPVGTERICAGSLLFVERRYRYARKLSAAICNLGYYWAISRGLTHVLAATNPDVEAFFRRASYVRVAPPMYSDSSRLPFIPMVLDLEALRKSRDCLPTNGFDSSHPYKTSLLLEYDSAHG